MSYTCRYCKKSFSRENTLAIHVCEPKKRIQEQNETGVRLGFNAYLKFYEITQGSEIKVNLFPVNSSVRISSEKIFDAFNSEIVSSRLST